MQDLFYDFVAPNIRDASFPRANHISKKDLDQFKHLKLDELKALVKKVRAPLVSDLIYQYFCVKPLQQARRLNETVYKNDYKVGKVASNGTVANASLSVRSSS